MMRTEYSVLKEVINDNECGWSYEPGYLLQPCLVVYFKMKMSSEIYIIIYPVQFAATYQCVRIN